MAEKRKNWNGLISGFKASDLVFLDESGCNTDMTRRYAYSLGGSRAVDSAPLSKPKNTTILSSIQLDGTLHYTTFSGGTTVERFKRYLETDLLSHLNGTSHAAHCLFAATVTNSSKTFHLTKSSRMGVKISSRMPASVQTQPCSTPSSFKMVSPAWTVLVTPSTVNANAPDTT